MLHCAKIGRSVVLPSIGMFGPLMTIVPIPDLCEATKPQVQLLEARPTPRQHLEDRSLPTRPPLSNVHRAPDRSGKKTPVVLVETQTAPPPSKSPATTQRPSAKPASGGLIAEYLRVARGLVECQLDPVEEGVGGTYFLKTKAIKGSKKVGVFKPADEEAGSRNNPKGYSEDDHEKGGIKTGEGWKREILAYRLDHYHFAGVPETIEVKFPNGLFERPDKEKGCKVGSLQRFVQNSDGTPCKASCDMGPGAFPIDDVHRIGQLDIRLLNCDRHGGNALVQKDARGALHMVPIDHSYILPKHAADLDFEWLFWPQSKEPFSTETAKYIGALQPELDAAVMRKSGLEEESVELMLAATKALQKGCAQGLSLRTIGRFMRRERLYDLSGFEKAVLDSRSPIEEGGDIEFSRLDGILDERLGELIESPLLKPIRLQPVTFKEEVLVTGVIAEPVSPDPSGTYFIKDATGHCIAIFRSPAPWKGSSTRRDLISREVAAFRLDDQHWAGVPETVEMHAPNDLFPKHAHRAGLPFKHGSLQKFIPGPLQPLCDVPLDSLPVQAVHRIGILDVRLCNTDRHCRSILQLRKEDGSVGLVPTSHAGILPQSFAQLRFLWCSWPQAKEPFSDADVHYVQQLEPELDVQLLQELGISAKCIELHQVASIVLKEAVSQRFTLRQIGLLFEQTSPEQPSCMERLLAAVRLPADQGGSVDFDALRRGLREWLHGFGEEVRAAEEEWEGRGATGNLCCSCAWNGTLSQSDEVKSTEYNSDGESVYSFAESDDSFAWERE